MFVSILTVTDKGGDENTWNLESPRKKVDVHDVLDGCVLNIFLAGERREGTDREQSYLGFRISVLFGRTLWRCYETL